MPWQKKVADFLTLTRAPLALALIGLGFTHGRDGIEIAWLLLLSTATIDTLDGYFARLASGHVTTWIGTHDLFFDLLFSTALLLYLVLGGYVAPVLAALYLALWGIIIGATNGAGNVRAIAFQAPMYLITLWAAIADDSRRLLWTGAWLAVMVLFAGRRFVSVRLPALARDLFDTINDFTQKRRNSR